MKTLFIVLTLVIFTGCSSAPYTVRVKNCKYVGSGLYDCEELDHVLEGRK